MISKKSGKEETERNVHQAVMHQNDQKVPKRQSDDTCDTWPKGCVHQEQDPGRVHAGPGKIGQDQNQRWNKLDQNQDDQDQNAQNLTNLTKSSIHSIKNPNPNFDGI